MFFLNNYKFLSLFLEKKKTNKKNGVIEKINRGRHSKCIVLYTSYTKMKNPPSGTGGFISQFYGWILIAGRKYRPFSRRITSRINMPCSATKPTARLSTRKAVKITKT